jgi:hypothetical protein
VVSVGHSFAISRIIMAKPELSGEAGRAADPRRTEPVVDLTRPETSAVLQSILKDSKAKDAKTRFSAIHRFQNIFLEITRGSGNYPEITADAASFLLERGFMTPIVEGLKAAAAGRDWLLIPPFKRNATGSEFTRTKVIKPVVLAKALECLAVDRRAVSYMLKETPSLASMLKCILLVEPTESQKQLQLRQLPHNRVRTFVMRTLVHLASFSAAVGREISNSIQLLAKIMRRAMRDFEDQDLVGSSIAFLSPMVRSRVDILALLETDILDLTVRILLESQNQVHIVAASGCIADLVRAQGMKPLPEIPGLKSAVYAMVLCSKLMPEVKEMALFMACVIAGRDADPETGESTDYFRSLALLAVQDPIARNRAAQLNAIFSAEEPNITSFLVPVGVPDRDEVAEAAKEHGFRVRHLKAVRQCSGPGCERAEKEPEEFKMCGGSRLAVYCGRGTWTASRNIVASSLCSSAAPLLRSPFLRFFVPLKLRLSLSSSLLLSVSSCLKCLFEDSPLLQTFVTSSSYVLVYVPSFHA